MSSGSALAGVVPSQGDLIRAGSYLLGISAPPAQPPTPSGPIRKDLSTVLNTRLTNYHSLAAEWQSRDWPSQPGPASASASRLGEADASASLQTQTARAATRLLSLLIDRLNQSPKPPTPAAGSASTGPASVGLPPVLGQRDHQVVSQLSGVIARWGIAALVRPEVLPPALAGPGAPVPAPAPRPASRFSEVDDAAEAQNAANEVANEAELGQVTRLLLETTLPGPDTTQGRKELAGVVRAQVALPVVGALVQLGYGGTAEAGVADWAKGALDAMFARTSPTQVLATLLSLLSAAPAPSAVPPPSPNSVPKALRPFLSRLLSAQLFRPGGIRGLLIVVVGQDDDVGARKLDTIARLVIAGAGAAPDRLAPVVSQVLDVLGSAAHASVAPPGAEGMPAAPEGVLRAASFVVAQLVGRDVPGARDVLLACLHAPFVAPTVAGPAPSPLEGLTTLSLLVSHAPPTSPPSLLLSTFVTPVVPALLALEAVLHAGVAPGITVLGSSGKGKGKETSADELENELGAVLETWAKSVPNEEAVRAVARAVERLEETDGARWARGERGEVHMMSPSEVEGENESDQTEVDAERIVGWLERVGRKELSGGLFVRWLDELQVLRGTPGLAAATRSVTRLQLVLKMIQDLGSDILDHSPIHIIGFVAHALNVGQPDNRTAAVPSAPAAQPTPSKASGSGITLADLRIVPDEAENSTSAEDEENANEGDVEGLGLGGDEMVVTGLTLLLAVLEGHPELTIASTPLLGLIFARLESIAANPKSELVPPLAQEARMVLSARQAASLASAGQASWSGVATGASDPHAASRKTYQDALLLLQDPLLPVRAQGLAHLKGLVESGAALLQTDPALVPAIVDIFLQAVEDDDSFLYLSAVQGLSGLVDKEGRGMVRRLVRVYVGGEAQAGVRGVGEGEKGRRELEKRLRVGEALGQVVERAGESLARFADDLVPALLVTLRDHQLPTPLRASALTVLAGALEVAPLALLNYADELGEACVTLLALESVQIQPKIRAMDEPQAPLPLGKDGQPRRAEETPHPVAADAKRQPSLRRAAVLLLGLLFRSAARLEEEDMNRAARGVEEVQVEGLLGGGLRMPSGRRIELSGLGRAGGGRGGLVREVGAEEVAEWQGLVRAETRERARRVLRYLTETDVDGLVRHQAGEVLEELGGGGGVSVGGGLAGSEGLVLNAGW